MAGRAVGFVEVFVDADTSKLKARIVEELEEAGHEGAIAARKEIESGFSDLDLKKLSQRIDVVAGRLQQQFSRVQLEPTIKPKTDTRSLRGDIERELRGPFEITLTPRIRAGGLRLMEEDLRRLQGRIFGEMIEPRLFDQALGEFVTSRSNLPAQLLTTEITVINLNEVQDNFQLLARQLRDSLDVRGRIAEIQDALDRLHVDRLQLDASRALSQVGDAVRNAQSLLDRSPLRARVRAELEPGSVGVSVALLRAQLDAARVEVPVAVRVTDVDVDAARAAVGDLSDDIDEVSRQLVELQVAVDPASLQAATDDVQREFDRTETVIEVEARLDLDQVDRLRTGAVFLPVIAVGPYVPPVLPPSILPLQIEESDLVRDIESQLLDSRFSIDVKCDLHLVGVIRMAGQLALLRRLAEEVCLALNCTPGLGLELMTDRLSFLIDLARKLCEDLECPPVDVEMRIDDEHLDEDLGNAVDRLRRSFGSMIVDPGDMPEAFGFDPGDFQDAAQAAEQMADALAGMPSLGDLLGQIEHDFPDITVFVRWDFDENVFRAGIRVLGEETGAGLGWEVGEQFVRALERSMRNFHFDVLLDRVVRVLPELEDLLASWTPEFAEAMFGADFGEDLADLQTASFRGLLEGLTGASRTAFTMADEEVRRRAFAIAEQIQAHFDSMDLTLDVGVNLSVEDFLDQIAMVDGLLNVPGRYRLDASMGFDRDDLRMFEADYDEILELLHRVTDHRWRVDLDIEIPGPSTGELVQTQLSDETLAEIEANLGRELSVPLTVHPDESSISNLRPMVEDEFIDPILIRAIIEPDTDSVRVIPEVFGELVGTMFPDTLVDLLDQAEQALRRLSVDSTVTINPENFEQALEDFNFELEREMNLARAQAARGIAAFTIDRIIGAIRSAARIAFIELQNIPLALRIETGDVRDALTFREWPVPIQPTLSPEAERQLAAEMERVARDQEQMRRDQQRDLRSPIGRLTVVPNVDLDRFMLELEIAGVEVAQLFAEPLQNALEHLNFQIIERRVIEVWEHVHDLVESMQRIQPDPHGAFENEGRMMQIFQRVQELASRLSDQTLTISDVDVTDESIRKAARYVAATFREFGGNELTVGVRVDDDAGEDLERILLWAQQQLDEAQTTMNLQVGSRQDQLRLSRIVDRIAIRLAQSGFHVPVEVELSRLPDLGRVLIVPDVDAGRFIAVLELAGIEVANFFEATLTDALDMAAQSFGLRFTDPVNLSGHRLSQIMGIIQDELDQLTFGPDADPTAMDRTIDRIRTRLNTESFLLGVELEPPTGEQLALPVARTTNELLDIMDALLDERQPVLVPRMDTDPLREDAAEVVEILTDLQHQVIESAEISRRSTPGGRSLSGFRESRPSFNLQDTIRDLEQALALQARLGDESARVRLINFQLRISEIVGIERALENAARGLGPLELTAGLDTSHIEDQFEDLRDLGERIFGSMSAGVPEGLRFPEHAVIRVQLDAESGRLVANLELLGNRMGNAAAEGYMEKLEQRLAHTRRFMIAAISHRSFLELDLLLDRINQMHALGDFMDLSGGFAKLTREGREALAEVQQIFDRDPIEVGFYFDSREAFERAAKLGEDLEAIFKLMGFSLSVDFEGTAEQLQLIRDDFQVALAHLSMGGHGFDPIQFTGHLRFDRSQVEAEVTRLIAITAQRARDRGFIRLSFTTHLDDIDRFVDRLHGVNDAFDEIADGMEDLRQLGRDLFGEMSFDPSRLEIEARNAIRALSESLPPLDLQFNADLLALHAEIQGDIHAIEETNRINISGAIDVDSFDLIEANLAIEEGIGDVTAKVHPEVDPTELIETNFELREGIGDIPAHVDLQVEAGQFAQIRAMVMAATMGGGAGGGGGPPGMGLAIPGFISPGPQFRGGGRAPPPPPGFFGSWVSNAGDAGSQAADQFGRSFFSRIPFVWKAIGALILALFEPAMVGLAGLASAAIAVVSSAFSAVAGTAGALVPIFAALAPLIGSIVVGFQNMGGAFKAVNKGFTEAVRSGKEFDLRTGDIQQALGLLAPSARSFVEEFSRVLPVFHEIQQNVQGALFEGLDQSLRELATDAIPSVGFALEEAASSVNLFFQDIADEANKIDWLNLFVGVQPAIEHIGQGLSGLLGPIMDFIKAATPGASELGKSIKVTADSLGDMIEAGVKSGAITKFILDGIESFKIWWQLIRNTGDALFTLFAAGKDQGDSFIQSLSNMIGRWDAWMESLQGQIALQEFFDTGRAVMDSLKPVLEGLQGLIDRMVTEEAIERFDRLAEALGFALPYLSDIFELFSRLSLVNNFVEAIGLVGEALETAMPSLRELADALGKGLTDAIEAIAPALPALAEGLTAIVSVITPAAVVLMNGIALALSAIAEVIQLIPAPAFAAVAALVGLKTLFDGLLLKGVMALWKGISTLVVGLQELWVTLLAHPEFLAIAVGIGLIANAIMNSGKEAKEAKQLVKDYSDAILQIPDAGPMIVVQETLEKLRGEQTGVRQGFRDTGLEIGTFFENVVMGTKSANDQTADWLATIVGANDPLVEMVRSGQVSLDDLHNAFSKSNTDASAATGIYANLGDRLDENNISMDEAEHMFGFIDDQMVALKGSGGEVNLMLFEQGGHLDEDGKLVQDYATKLSGVDYSNIIINGQIANDIIHGIGLGIDNTGQAAAANAPKLGGFAVNTRTFADATAYYTRIQKEADEATRRLAAQIDHLMDTKFAAEEAINALDPIDQLAIKFGTLKLEAEHAATAAEGLQTSFDLLVTPNINAGRAFDALFENLDKVTEALNGGADAAQNAQTIWDNTIEINKLLADRTADNAEETDKQIAALRTQNEELANSSAALNADADALSARTEAGREAREALFDDIAGLMTFATTQLAAGVSSEFVADRLARQRQKLIDTGVAAGVSEEKMEKFVNQMGLTPEFIESEIRTPGLTDAQKNLRALRQIARELNMTNISLQIGMSVDEVMKGVDGIANNVDDLTRGEAVLKITGDGILAVQAGVDGILHTRDDISERKATILVESHGVPENQEDLDNIFASIVMINGQPVIIDTKADAIEVVMAGLDGILHTTDDINGMTATAVVEASPQIPKTQDDIDAILDKLIVVDGMVVTVDTTGEGIDVVKAGLDGVSHTADDITGKVARQVIESDGFPTTNTELKEIIEKAEHITQHEAKLKLRADGIKEVMLGINGVKGGGDDISRKAAVLAINTKGVPTTKREMREVKELAESLDGTVATVTVNVGVNAGGLTPGQRRNLGLPVPEQHGGQTQWGSFGGEAGAEFFRYRALRGLLTAPTFLPPGMMVSSAALTAAQLRQTGPKSAMPMATIDAREMAALLRRQGANDRPNKIVTVNQNITPLSANPEAVAQSMLNRAAVLAGR